MNLQDLRNLQEAYMKVVVDDLNEMSYQKLPIGRMMRQAIKKGARALSYKNTINRTSPVYLKSLRKREDRGETVEYPTVDEYQKKLEKHVDSMIQIADAHSEEEARAKSKLKKEQVDIYDIILSHLLDEGYANTLESAEVILENMSERWIDSIIEAFVDPEEGEAPSGRSPLENVSYHPNKKVRKKAVRAMTKQMEKEYGGKWKAKYSDPVDG